MNSSILRRNRLLAGTAILSLTPPAVAQAAEPWVAPAEARAKTNPLSGDTKAAVAGKTTFTANCMVCHGPLGQGDGPAAAALTPKPANFTTSTETEGGLFWKLGEGRGAMVSFKTSLTENQRWEIVAYLKTLQKGAPTATPAPDVIPEKKGTLTGAELWSMHCNRCHDYRISNEFTAAQWATILLHMKVRANLPADQAREIQKFLQAGAGK